MVQVLLRGFVAAEDRRRGRAPSGPVGIGPITSESGQSASAAWRRRASQLPGAGRIGRGSPSRTQPGVHPGESAGGRLRHQSQPETGQPGRRQPAGVGPGRREQLLD